MLFDKQSQIARHRLQMQNPKTWNIIIAFVWVNSWLHARCETKPIELRCKLRRDESIVLSYVYWVSWKGGCETKPIRRRPRLYRDKFASLWRETPNANFEIQKPELSSVKQTQFNGPILRRRLRMTECDISLLSTNSAVKQSRFIRPASNVPRQVKQSQFARLRRRQYGLKPILLFTMLFEKQSQFFILHFSSWVTRVGVLKQSQSRRSSVSHIFFCNRWLRLFTAFFRTQNKAKSKPISRGSVSGESLSPFSRQIRNLLFHFGQNILIISACSVLRSAKYFARGTQSSEYRTSKLWVIFVKV